MKALGEVGPAKGLTVEGRAVRDIVVVCNKIVLFEATTNDEGKCGARDGTDFRKVAKFQMKQQKKFNAVSQSGLNLNHGQDTQSVNSTQVNSNLESTFDRLPVIGCAVVYEMTSVTFDSGKTLPARLA